MNKIERKINRTVQLAKNVRLHRADGGETDPMLDQDFAVAETPNYGRFSPVTQVPTTRDGQTYYIPGAEAQRFRPAAAPKEIDMIGAGSLTAMPREIQDPTKFARTNAPVSEMLPSKQEMKDAALMAAAGFGSFVPETAHFLGMGKDVLSGKRPDFEAKTPYGYEEMVKKAQESGAISQEPGAIPQIIGAGSQFVTDPANLAAALKTAAGAKMAMSVIPKAATTTEKAVELAKAPRSDLGFYSHGSETAANLPQAKGPADQLIGMLRNQGVRPEELAHAGLIDEAAIAAKQAEIQAAYAPRIQAAEQGLAGLVEGTPEYKTAKRLYDNTVSSMRAEMNNALVVHPDWAGKPVTREELSQHLHQSMPQVEERVLGKTMPGTPYPEEYKQLEESIKQKYDDAYKSAFVRFQDQTLPQAERIAAENDIRNIQKQFLAEVNEQIPDRNLLLAQAQDKFHPTRFSDLTIPGGENYRELLLKLPPNEVTLNDISNKLFAKDFRDLTSLAQEKAVRNELERLGPRMGLDFTESHWEDPNVLAHLRMADRVGPNGEKLLHVEEIQSDWGQKGREQGFADPNAKKQFDAFVDDMRSQAKEKGYNNAINQGLDAERAKELTDRIVDSLRPSELAKFLDNHAPRQADQIHENKLNHAFSRYKELSQGLPPSPYVTSTQGWTDLALKRVMKEAAEGGYDGVVFTPGSEQAKRFDLSKQISKVTYDPHEMELYAYDKAGNEVINEYNVQPKDLHKYIGKEPAEKLRAEVDNAASVINEYDVGKDPDTGRWEISLYGEPLHDYGGQLLQFKSEDAAKSHLQEMIASETRYNLPTLSGLDLQVGGEGMTGYYDKIVPSRLKELMKGHDKEAKLGTSPIAGGKYEVVSQDGNVIVTEDSKRAAQNIAQGLGLERYTIRQQDAIHGLHMPMTDKMRQSILSGQKAFNEGGRVGFAGGGSPPWGFDFNQPTINYQPPQPSVPPLADFDLYKGAPKIIVPPKEEEEPEPEKKEDETKHADSGQSQSAAGGEGSVGGTSGDAGEAGGSGGTDSGSGSGGERYGGAITMRRYRANGGPIRVSPIHAEAGPSKISPAQAKAGNYKKKHLNFQGLPLSIETPKGHVREKIINGKLDWRVKMPVDYGYVKGTKDNDGDASDVFVGPHKKSDKVWVIDQADHRTGKFDEHKAMLGFKHKHKALKAYKDSFSDGKAHKRIMDATKLSVQEYKDWIKHGDLKKPVSSSPFIQKALMVASKKS